MIRDETAVIECARPMGGGRCSKISTFFDINFLPERVCLSYDARTSDTRRWSLRVFVPTKIATS